MDYRRLGASGFTVPVLSFGTGTFCGKGEFFSQWGSTDVDEARRLVDICMDAGVTMFDSADTYSAGAAEEILGQAIKEHPRDGLILSTKATFRCGEAPNAVGSSRFHLIDAVEKALKRLDTDYIDLFQLHGFDAMTPPEEVLSTLDQLVREGKVSVQWFGARWAGAALPARSAAVSHWPRPAACTRPPRWARNRRTSTSTR
jgi:aryl-alcohol dehydrogenase-like predicted oxidoreductase